MELLPDSPLRELLFIFGIFTFYAGSMLWLEEIIRFGEAFFNYTDVSDFFDYIAKRYGDNAATALAFIATIGITFMYVCLPILIIVIITLKTAL